MTPRPLSLFVCAFAFALPLRALAQTSTETEKHTFNQEGKFNEKDMKLAKELAPKDKDWDKLSEAERQAVLQTIAIEVHGRRRKISQAIIQVNKGKSLTDTGDNFCSAPKKKPPTTLEMGGFLVTYSEQDSEKTASTDKVIFLEEVPILPVEFRDVFEDNSWKVSAAGELQIKQSVANSFAAFDALKAKHPKAVASVGAVHIDASASTVFNHAYADPADTNTRLTHRQLSRARANSINRIVRAELSSRGVLWDKTAEPSNKDFTYDDENDTEDQDKTKGRQIFTDSAGNNGNGTSGPDSPYNCPTWLIPGADKNPAVASKRAEFAAKFCVNGNAPASAEAKAWAQKEGEANGRQDPKTAAVYAKKIENAYETYRFVAVNFDGLARVEEKEHVEGQKDKAHIVLVKVTEKTKSKTKDFDTVKVTRHKGGFLLALRCKLGLAPKSKCPIPCAQF